MPVTTIYLTTTNGGSDHISSGGMISTDFIIFYCFCFNFGYFFMFFFVFLRYYTTFVCFLVYLSVVLLTDHSGNDGTANTSTIPGS